MKAVLFLTSAVASLIAHGVAQSIDPDEVPLATRDSWCTSQIASCPLICLQKENDDGSPYSNDCDPSTLQYSCVCSNGQSPNISEYSQTVPYYICTQANTDCQTACGSNNDCAAACLTNHPCGAQNPTRVNQTATSSSATGTGTQTGDSSTAVYNGFGSSSTASSDPKSGAARVIVNMGQIYGLGVVAAGVFAGFTLLL